jgi:CheY-like chemotaxis protein
VRIFIVEDEALIAMELEDRLVSLGHEVCGHALRGEEALARIPAARPDLVLMDVNLGRGLSGLEVADRLAGQPVRIVFLSAYTPAELEERARRGEPIHHLVKPFRPEALQAAIAAAMA